MPPQRDPALCSQNLSSFSRNDCLIRKLCLTWRRNEVGVAGHGGVEDAEGDAIEDLNHEGKPGIGQEGVEQ